MYSCCFFANDFAIGELICASLPQPVERTGATASSISAALGGGTASTTGGAAAATTGSGVGGGGVGAATGGAGVGSGAAAASGSAAGATKSLKAATSSSSSTVTKMGVPTGTSSAPASFRILAMYPSSCASKSIDALSVSILAKASPAMNSLPSSRYHSAKVPWSMVGESAGMPTTMWYGRLSSCNADETWKDRHPMAAARLEILVTPLRKDDDAANLEMASMVLSWSLCE
mmetsp:Transcript_18700/g.52003  ORF Transcript_18700/g.52003 Transcript_18700/m.52003 type:complete len:231 (-) Transcript_18700:137-829(-)